MKRKLILAAMMATALLFAAVALSLPPAVTAQGVNISCQVNIYRKNIQIFQTGVILSTTIRVPIAVTDTSSPNYCPPLANGKWPMIITMHGVTQDQSKVDAIAASNAMTLAVIAVDFDWRGHGGSSGWFDWSVSNEWTDLHYLTNYLIDTYPHTAGKIEPTRLGLEGRSMGAEHTEMAAAVARSLTWEYPYTSAVAFDNTSYPDLHNAVNGCFNNSARQWLASTITTVNWFTGTPTVLRNYYANNNVMSWTNYFSDTSRNWSQYLNTITPTRLFEQVSWTDLIQYPNQSFDVFHINPSPVSPSQTKRLYMASNGHEEFLVFGDVAVERIAERRGWHQTWLHDLAALDGGPVTYLEYQPGDPTDPANHTIVQSPDWPPTGAMSLTVYLRDTQKLTVGKPKPGSDNGHETITHVFSGTGVYTPLIALDESPSYTSYPTYFVTTTAVFTTNVLSQTVHWTGAPQINYFTSSSDRPYHIQAQFFDVTPGGSDYLITRADSCWGPDETSDPANRTVVGLSHARLITAGHQIKVVFSDVDLETSSPSTTLLRMKPVFGNSITHITHTWSLSTSIVLPISPTLGIFQNDGPHAWNGEGDPIKRRHGGGAGGWGRWAGTGRRPTGQYGWADG